MGRSTKKGPFVEERLLSADPADERERRQADDQDLVARARRSSPRWSATRSPFTTGESTSRCSSPSRWWATSSASSPRRAPSGPTPGPRRSDRDGASPRRSPTAPVVRASARYVRVAPRKARLVADQVRGLPVPEARTLLRLLGPRRRARHREADRLGRRQRGEQPRARGRGSADRGDQVDEGPTLKRWRARARGRATRIDKRTSHVSVALTPTDGRKSERWDRRSIPRASGSATSTTGSRPGSTSASSRTTCSRTSRSATTSSASSRTRGSPTSRSSSSAARSRSTSTPRARGS